MKSANLENLPKLTQTMVPDDVIMIKIFEYH